MDKKFDLGLGHYAVRYLGQCMGFASGRKWLSHKAAFRTSLSSSTADSSLANISASLDDWESNVLLPLAKSGETIRLHDMVGKMPITVMINICFGNKFAKNHTEILDQLRRDADLISETIIHNRWAAAAFYKYFDTEANQSLHRFKTNWKKLIQSYESSEERLQGEGGVFDLVLDHIMEGSKKDTITFDEAAATMAEIVVANQDVLQPAITWLFADLLVYPQYLEALSSLKPWEVIDKAALETSHSSLLNIIQESMRVHPPATISMTEITGKDISIGGYDLPKGTNVSIDLYSMNHNTKCWSEPEEFKPERFESINDFNSKWGFFKFGFGARRCPGQYYANLILANAMTRLFSKFDVKCVGWEGINRHDQLPLLGPGALTMLPDCKIKIFEKGIIKIYFFISTVVFVQITRTRIRCMRIRKRKFGRMKEKMMTRRMRM